MPAALSCSGACCAQFPQIRLPEELWDLLREMQDALAVLNFDIFDLVPLECLLSGARVQFAAKLVATMLMPVALVQGLLGYNVNRICS